MTEDMKFLLDHGLREDEIKQLIEEDGATLEELVATAKHMLERDKFQAFGTELVEPEDEDTSDDESNGPFEDPSFFEDDDADENEEGAFGTFVTFVTDSAHCENPIPVKASVDENPPIEDNSKACETKPAAKWGQVTRLEDVEVPAFPLKCLPPALREYVEALAESSQTPLELAGTIGIGVLAIAFQRMYIVQVTPDWKEVLSMYLVAIAPPADRKSSIFKAMLRPIYNYEEKRQKLEAISIARAKAEWEVLELRLTLAKRAAAKGGTEKELEEVYKLSDKLANFKVPCEFRLVVDDTTPEKLIDIMDGQGGCITVASSEGGVFGSMVKQYNKVGNLDIYLKGHTGDSIRVDRVGRGPNYIRSPRLSIILTVQPEVVEGVMSNITLRGRGLCGRFLYAVCQSKVGRRKVSPSPVPEKVEQEYQQFVEEILSTSEEGKEGTVTLSQEADDLRREYQYIVEERLGNEWKEMQDWGGKLVGTMVRIAALLHLAEHPVTEPISEKTMLAAMELADFYATHAQAVYKIMSENKVIADAKYVWKRLSESGADSMSKRDLLRLCHGKFEKADDLDQALETLGQMNYIKIDTQTTGGRPSKKIYVNPQCQK